MDQELPIPVLKHKLLELVASEITDDKLIDYSLWKIAERGDLFVLPATEVYEGMIIGINSRSNDLDVNPIKNKQLTNVRSAGTDEATKVPEPIILSLEEALEFIESDELVEITPESIRLRKKTLDKRYRGKEHKIQ